jgi:hypothetical protein
MKPLECINNLWKEKFFEEFKSLSEIEDEINKKWKVTPSNLLMTLKLKSVRKFLIGKNKKWKQRFPFIENKNELEILHFESGKPRTSRKTFLDLIKSIEGDIKICDPYLTEDTLDALEIMKKAKIKFLTSGLRNNIKVSTQDLQSFKAENSFVEIKGINSDCLHDRYILTKNTLYLLGQGFSIRKKESFVIILPEKFSKDLIQSLSSQFDIRWRNQNNIVLC